MDGFSPDGYIVDQNCFTQYPYRRMTSNVNGCGWIAAYNLRRAAGQETDFDQVRTEMDRMFRLPIPGPTPMGKLRRYLGRYLRCDFSVGRARSLAAAAAAPAGILRYWEGRVPHFVAFVRREEGDCRFFNVSDGEEELLLPMDRFFAEHCRRGLVRALTLP